MGFDNPSIPWREMESYLSGRAGTTNRAALLTRPPEHDVPTSRKRPAYQAPEEFEVVAASVEYAELHAHSSFSWLDGASSPEEMVEQAAKLSLSALAITDHDGMYAAPRFAAAAEELGVDTIFGAELSLDTPVARTATDRMTGARVGMPDPPGTHLVVLAREPDGYAALCRVISEAHLRAGVKGRPIYDADEVADAAAGGHWLVLTGGRKGPLNRALGAGGGMFALDLARAALVDLVDRFGAGNVAVELTYGTDPLADERTDALHLLATEAGLPVVATGGAHYHEPNRRRLATVMAATRARSTLPAMAGWLPPEQHLRSGAEMAARFARWPGAVENAAQFGSELTFPLHLVAPALPPFPVADGFTDEMAYLRHLTHLGAQKRYGGRDAALQERAYAQIERELGIIEQLNFPGYFLVVWEIAKFCRESGILCQGRGSAANSAVCYALEVTAVDPVGYGLLFERFLSVERAEAPDIDVDIESDRREEVIQHVYATHGRRHAAQVANVITYRPRSAVRDVAKALGYSAGQQDAWSTTVERYSWHVPEPRYESEDTAVDDAPGQGQDGEAQMPRIVAELAEELSNTPRHLGVHSGGMVMCDRPIIEVCPVEWARKEGRTVLQWDKDDCEYAGLVKFDLLGLGMLSALHYCFDMIEQRLGLRLGLYDIPADDAEVYDMLCAGDTVGVFQIESRAQMSTLPRLKPRCFYDLVVEIALIRPGPIQGDAVHPYLRRRDGIDPVTYSHPDLEPVLAKTLGVPLFQEQLMEIAIRVCGFSPGQADELRRAMGSKRSAEKMVALKERLYSGMAAHGLSQEAADDIYHKIQAFAAFGFPESHSISFAFLAYASSWLKLRYPAEFLASLLNAQPMGFYSPQSLVHDARRHGVVVHGPAINLSAAAAILEQDGAVRLGISSVRAIGSDLAERIVALREAGGPYASMTDLAGRVGLSTDHVEALATAGAFDGFGITRRDALWESAVAASRRPDHLDVVPASTTLELPPMSLDEQLVADLWATGISGDYPTALVRDRLTALGVLTAADLRGVSDRTRVLVGGVVTHRQRPSSAGGVTFLSLEDETGLVNVICSPGVWERHSRIARDSGALMVRGMLERGSGAISIVAERIARLPLAANTRSRDFR